MLAANSNASLSALTQPYEVLGSTEDRETWLKLRLGGIGASEMAAVMGLYRYSSALEVYARKIGALERGDDDVGEPAYWGNQLEALVVAEFSKRTGRKVERQCQLLRSTVYPWAICTLDALVLPEQEPLEAKTASAFLLDDWANGTPLYYQIQCHQQMLVTGASRVYAACLVGGQRFIWDVVERDETLISDIIVAGNRFWRCIEDRTPPSPDGSDSAERALEALVAERVEDIDRRPTLPPRLAAASDELERVQLALRAASADVRELTKSRGRLQQEIRLAMGGAKYASLGGWVYVDEVRKRGSYTVEPCEWHELRRSTYEDEVAKATRKAKKEDRKARIV